jgi:hypothetical protein
LIAYYYCVRLLDRMYPVNYPFSRVFESRLQQEDCAVVRTSCLQLEQLLSCVTILQTLTKPADDR